MKQLRVAILGQGRSGRDIHGEHLHKDTERFKVAYVVDPMEPRRKRAEEEFPGCVTFENYQSLFGKDDIDLVINCTPSHLHQPISVDLLNHGFNVMSEKPLARTAAEVDELIEAEKKSGKMMAVFQQTRFAPFFLKIKEVLASGVLGRVVQVKIQYNGFQRRWDWQTLQEFNGGSLYNTGPHPVDMALNLLDDYDIMPNVLCRLDRVNTYGDAEDYVKLIMTAPGKPLFDVEISSCDAYPFATYNIQCANGGLTSDTHTVSWRYFKPDEAPTQKLIKTPLCDENYYPLYCGEKLQWYDGTWNANGADAFVQGTRSIYTTFYEHLTKGTPLVVTLKQVRQQIAVMEECHRQNPLSRLD